MSTLPKSGKTGDKVSAETGLDINSQSTIVPSRRRRWRQHFFVSSDSRGINCLHSITGDASSHTAVPETDDAVVISPVHGSGAAEAPSEVRGSSCDCCRPARISCFSGVATYTSHRCLAMSGRSWRHLRSLIILTSSLYSIL